MEESIVILFFSNSFLVFDFDQSLVLIHSLFCQIIPFSRHHLVFFLSLIWNTQKWDTVSVCNRVKWELLTGRTREK